MARDGNGVFSSVWTTAQPNTTIQSTNANSMVADFEADANTDRPVVAGGTGASTAAGACDNLEALHFGAAQTISAADQKQGRQNIGAALSGHIYGLTLSNNSTDATNDIDIAAGEAASSESNPVLITLASGITKQLDAAWTVGDDQGGLDTGSIANTTYHVFLIQRSDTGVVDVLFSTSATSPTMPTNYDRKRRIGSIIRNGGNIAGFSQFGDEFLLTSSSAVVSETNPGTSAVTRTLLVPAGVKVIALLNVVLNNAGTTNAIASVTSLDTSDVAPSNITWPLVPVSTSKDAAGGVVSANGFTRVRTNTSSQVRSRVSHSDANVTIRIGVIGWIDDRGRNG